MALTTAQRRQLQIALTDKTIANAIADAIDNGGNPQAANVAALGGTLTGTVDGDLADVQDIALSTGDSYTDAAVNAAVNAAIAEMNEQIKEIQTTLNAEIAALKASGQQASS